MGQFPNFTVLHIPHDSTDIPSTISDQFLLTPAELAHELTAMTDWHTQEAFLGSQTDVVFVRSDVSRLVVDVERFVNDDEEIMSRIGMGAVYMSTSNGLPLRRPLSTAERQDLLDTYYFPHHARFEAAVDKMLLLHQQCLIIDCHSFPSKPLPYESHQESGRPQICIGSDPFHTPQTLISKLLRTFQQAGFTVKENYPFAGSIVPLKHYHIDKRVISFMVEIRRDLYIDESNGRKKSDFEHTMHRIRNCCQQAIAALNEV